MNDIDEMERYAMENIKELELQYQRAVAPYLKILADIQSLRPHSYMLEAKAMKMIEDMRLPSPPVNSSGDRQ